MGGTILERIVAQKKTEVAAAKKTVPAAAVEQEARAATDRRPFLAVLAQPGPHGVNIIAEIKRASPSKGIIREDLDPADYASRYQSAGAAALSVLTDEVFFRGSLGDLRRARAATVLPVLRKDFIISSYQVFESAAAGADAILLIVRILSARQLEAYLALAGELQVDALVEVHSEQELDRATAAGARLIGVNNRNLEIFKTDIATSIGLARRFGPQQVGVAESGIRSRQDVLEIRAAGIFNFLIGESLVRAEDTQARLRQFLGDGLK